MMWLRPTIIFLAVMGIGAMARGGPATCPAEGVRQAEIRRAMAGLADADAAVREKSFEQLLDLRREELEMLKAVVRESRPLAPSQAAALKDIVEHVYLSGDGYASTPQGFLGIHMARSLTGQERMGVVVEDRLPGFCGFKSLRDGDSVLDVDDRHLPQPLDQQVFTDAVREYKPGKELRLKVLRGGKAMQVLVKLDAWPTDEVLTRDGGVEGFVDRRLREAEAYWKENFARILENDGPAVR